MRLFSWNVNGIRAMLAKPDWTAWWEACDGDIIGLQETKAEAEQVPREARNPEQYHAYWLASQKRKGYSGVAAFSKVQPLAINYGLPDPAWQGEGRLIHLEYPEFHYFTVYFPNGQKDDTRLRYKLGYYAAFLEHAERLRKHKPIVVCGDFNTAHKPIDLARPKENENTSGFLPIEREWLDSFVAHGYVDTFRHVHGAAPEYYAWWSYRARAREKNIGWRIDYFFVSEELTSAIKDAWICADVYGSDHCPVALELAL